MTQATGRPRAALVAGPAALALFMAAPRQAETFRWAGTTGPQTMDPHAANLAPVTSFLNNI
jgi:peptide/nickel transport system substrate-binding protein